MLDAVFAQLRFAASVVFGLPFAPRSLDQLVDALRETRREFGCIGPEGAELLGGPSLDAGTRRAMQLRRFRALAGRGARETAYYRRLFARLGCDPVRLAWEDIAHLPVTSKEALRAEPDAFVRGGAPTMLRALTTGTTGRPTSVCFSEAELRASVALAAVSLLMTGRVTSEDIVQISTSSRAVLGNACFAGACARAGALVHSAGLVEPARALELLAEERRLDGRKPRVSVLLTYPSYLGELVEVGLGLGYDQADFGLERIAIGGEIVTDGLKSRCRRLFGPVRFDEGYGMTEIWPFGASRCEAGHLHFEASQGLLEVCSLDAPVAARPGEPGSIVATPFPPYREATVVLRYDTQDVARPMPGPLDCDLRHLPATGDLLGKRGLAVRHPDGWTFPRDVLEALEGVDAVPLPARCGFWAVSGGIAVEVVARDDAPHVRRAIEGSLVEHGVPVRELHLLQDRRRLRRPLPLRGDLREAMFGPPDAGGLTTIPGGGAAWSRGA